MKKEDIKFYFDPDGFADVTVSLSHPVRVRGLKRKVCKPKTQ